LKLPGLDERDVQLNKRQYVNTTAAASARDITINPITINATTMTTIKTIPKSIKVKFSGNLEGEGESNYSTLYV
jgi:hypothetical protein